MWLALSVLLATPVVGTRSPAQQAASPPQPRDSILRYITPLILVTGLPADGIRLDHLRGAADLDGFLIRSASSLSPRLPGKGLLKGAAIAPEYYAANNTAIPFSINDGPVWAGVGTSARTLLGFRLEAGPLSIIAAPEFLSIENKYWLIRDTARFYAPPIIKERQGGGFVFPWYINPYSIDLPLRMGPKSIHRVDAGQSTAMVTVRGASLGISNENQWWGPGIRNAIILSNNAAGFPHIFIRTSRPWRNRFGSIEARLLVGGLTESKWFDTTQTNNLRSLSAFAFTLRRRYRKTSFWVQRGQSTPRTRTDGTESPAGSLTLLPRRVAPITVHSPIHRSLRAGATRFIRSSGAGSFRMTASRHTPSGPGTSGHCRCVISSLHRTIRRDIHSAFSGLVRHHGERRECGSRVS